MMFIEDPREEMTEENSTRILIKRLEELEDNEFTKELLQIRIDSLVEIINNLCDHSDFELLSDTTAEYGRSERYGKKCKKCGLNYPITKKEYMESL